MHERCTICSSGVWYFVFVAFQSNGVQQRQPPSSLPPSMLPTLPLLPRLALSSLAIYCSKHTRPRSTHFMPYQSASMRGREAKCFFAYERLESAS
ncbi:hypothetical protein M0802_010314 [Mischocyttarus mexicanus]|nr:hypothetical protein M0802_010314 [Mischocyttarus mexicanus]